MNDILLTNKQKLDEVFHYLHTHPEVSWKEEQTTAYLKELIEREGFTVQTFDDCTGLFVEIGEGTTCIGVRADIDALWQEVDGVFQANHSCGHDAHMTMAFGALLHLKEKGFPKDIRFKWIFQPAEEKGKGAEKLVSKGIIDDIDYLYGVHLRPIQEIGDGTASPAIHHGAASILQGTISGQDAHAARPHLGANAIEVGAAIVQGLQGIRLDPMVPYSAKMTKLHAGSETGNIIPGNGSFSIDLRAQTNDMMTHLNEKVQLVLKQVEYLYDVAIDVNVHLNLVAAIVDNEACDLMERAIVDVLGEEYVQPPIVTPGGEDFHFYSAHVPTLKATMLGLGCDLSPGLHHPKMKFNQECIHKGSNILAQVVLLTAEEVKLLENVRLP
ncbi:MAG: M20 peptidase aminoacylase family protein [Paenisporosarcina sp.]|nr:M20 peptidase aminoacylase family protein [Paenisporosarcina sp.]